MLARPSAERCVAELDSADLTAADNRSRLATSIVAVLTSNTALAAMPGNVLLPAIATGLPKDSVVNVTALATIDRRALDPHPVGQIPGHLMTEVDHGLRGVLGLAPARSS